MARGNYSNRMRDVHVCEFINNLLTEKTYRQASSLSQDHRGTLTQLLWFNEIINDKLTRQKEMIGFNRMKGVISLNE